jgi:hypothetical protein
MFAAMFATAVIGMEPPATWEMRATTRFTCLGAEPGAEAAIGAGFLALSARILRRDVLVWVEIAARDVLAEPSIVL